MLNTPQEKKIKDKLININKNFFDKNDLEGLRLRL